MRVPTELRLMICYESLVASGGGVARSLAQPPLLMANRAIRKEALEIYYKENSFEITIARTDKDEDLGRGRKMPSVDSRAWNRFLYKWDNFRAVCDHLKKINKITIIYQLSMGNGVSWGDDDFDTRLGFQFSSTPFTNYWSDGASTVELCCDGNTDWHTRMITHHILFDRIVDLGKSYQPETIHVDTQQLINLINLYEQDSTSCGTSTPSTD
jgi:hypothetical protein